MKLSEYERAVLRDSPIYRKYATMPWSSITKSSVEADLDAITGVSIENLPIIKFLEMIHKSKITENVDDNLNSVIVINSDIEELMFQQHYSRHGCYASYISYGVTVSTIYVTETDITLSSGSVAATAIYAPGASKKFNVFFVEVSTDLAGAAGGQNYKLIFTEETTGNHYGTFCFNSLAQPIRIYPCTDPNGAGWQGSTNDKDLDVAISGGSDSEHVFVRVAAGTS